MDGITRRTSHTQTYHKTTNREKDALDWPPGKYQPLTGQSSCQNCPAGYYCDGVDPSKAIPCPRGHYCLANTAVANQYPCPEGTYNDRMSITQASDCTPCPKGYYCPIKGQASYADVCAYSSLNKNV